MISVTIPNSVTSIGEAAFADCSGLTSITIPNSVTSIGNYAFDYCKGLTSVVWNAENCANAPFYNISSQITSFTFGDSVKHIPASLCCSMGKLTSITIPNSVTSIGDYAFSGCSGLTSITIPNSVTSIGYQAFRGCSGLTSITIPNSVTSIGNQAFCYCEGLISVTIPNSVTSIGEAAFADCSGLTSITIPNSVTSIGYQAFRGCKSLTSITLGNSVTSIGERAFEGCKSLTSVTIPNSVTSIGDYAVAWCSGLTSVTIPNSVTSIGEWAFCKCSGLTKPVYNAHCFAYMPTSYEGAYTISDGIKQIAGGAFADCSGLTSITIPNSVTSIGERVFMDCSGLTSATIGNSVTSIGNYAFDGCKSLTSITLGNSVTSIGESAFEGCKSLTSVTIPNSVTSIGNQAFCYCEGLISVTIPNSVTSIGDSAFMCCSGLTSITIPNSVTSIGDYAFNHCRSLTSVTIPNSVTSIGYQAFAYCSGLTSVTIPNSVTSIRYRAFEGCSGLTSITIPNSVTSIGERVFMGCSGLTSITIPNSVTNIGESAFSLCYGLTSITIPNSVTSIEGGAFWGCSRLTSIESLAEIPPTLGSDAFYNVSTTIPVYVPCGSVSAYQSAEGWNAFSNIQETLLPKYSITVDVNDSIMGTSRVDYNTCSEGALTATPNCGYHFTQWSDGNTDNPRTVQVTEDTTYTAQFDKNIYTITTYCDNQMGSVTALDSAEYLDEITISATANYRYHFSSWSDGNTDNPRTLVLTQDTTFTAEFAVSYSGQCGDNLYWAYDEASKTIAITGSGDMYDYTADTQPWMLFKEELTEINISNKVTTIGTAAFQGCTRLGKVSIGISMKDISANAFANCTKLYDIYCCAAEPPTAKESSFANYNAVLHVPCESQRLYLLDILFGDFKYVECISSDEVSTNDVIINPGTTDVTITWPTDPNADTYVIVIKQGDKVFCKLTFNKDGMLLNIAFAPSRTGNHPTTYATQTAGGLRFTVTSLEEGTTYAYNITTKDEEENTISTYTGEFTTQSNTVTDLENSYSPSQAADCQKTIRDGQLIILRDGKSYSVMGQEL